VDGLGNPAPPATNPNVAPFNGSPFTGSLHYASVFGTVLNQTPSPGLFERRRSARPRRQTARGTSIGQASIPRDS
jgi:hypothetical protein